MQLKEAIKKSIQKYYEKGDEDWEHSKLEKRNYTKTYFDDFEAELMEEKNRSKGQKNKKATTKKDVSEI